MAQTVQILRTTTNTPPPTLLAGALSAELGTFTKLWLGATGGNRLLMSSDPADSPLGGSTYLKLAGGTLTGPLVLAANPTLPLGAATKQYIDTSFAPLASPVLTGNPTAPTAAPGDNDTSIATTAFVTAADIAAIAPLAPLASPVFTGDPRAPTPAAADNDTSVATTAFVKTALASLPAIVTTAPTTVNYTSGSGNYTPAAGVKWIEVQILGGGGGGTSSGTSGTTSPGTAGGTTTFGTMSATGGTAGNVGTGGTGSGGDLNLAGESGCYGTPSPSFSGSTSGGAGGSSILGGRGAGLYGAVGNALSVQGGGGGGGGATVNGLLVGSGGGAGGYCKKIIAAPGVTAYSVGAAGAGGAAGTSGTAGGAGGTGLISIVEHYNY